MVQIFYYETRGKCFKKLLRHDGLPLKVLLFPYEGWAQPAVLSHWTLIKTSWWSKKRCKIVEVCGTRKYTTTAKMVDQGNGGLLLKGRFKKNASAPDFRLRLSTNVSSMDFQKGYSLTGTLERGDRRRGGMQLTHFAMIKRKGY